MEMNAFRRVTVVGSVQGMDQVKKAYEDTADASTRAAGGVDSLSEAQERGVRASQVAAVAQDTAARSTLSSARNWDTLTRALDPAAKAQAALERSTRVVEAALRGGIATAAEAARAMQQLEERYTVSGQAAATAARQMAAWREEAAQARSAQVGQANWNSYAGVRDGSAGSARQSASVFEAQGEMLDKAASLRAQIDPLGAAQAKLNGQLAEYAELAKAGAISTTEHVTAQTLARKAFAETEEELKKHSDGLGLNRAQMMELTHSGKAMIDMMAAGTPALRALQVEGARLYQALSSGQGGVGGSLLSIGKSVVGLAAGWAGLAAGIGAVTVAGVTAAVSWENSQDRLAASLEGTGRRAGMSLAQLNAAAVAGARSGRLSDASGRDLAAGFAHAGLGSDLTTGLIGSTRAYARVTGQDVPAAGQQLAQAFADPASGLATLNKELGFVNDRLSQTVHEYQAQGNIEAARRVAMDAYLKAIAETTDRTWTLAAAFDGAKSGLSNFMSSIGRSIEHLKNGPTNAEREKELEANLARPHFSGGRGEGKRQLEDASDRAELQKLRDKDAAEALKAANQTAQANAAAKSSQAGDIVRSVLPDIVRAQDVSSQLQVLRAALSDPLTLQNMKQSPGDVFHAASNLAVQQQFADPMQRLAEDSKLAIASIDAYTIAEKAAVEARRAELQVLRESGDLVKAAAAAESARNEAIAKANSDAEDRLQISKQNLALVGLSPFERRMKEIDNKYNGYGGFLSRDNVTGSDFDKAWAPIRADFAKASEPVLSLASAATSAAAALNLIASGVSGGAPAGKLPIFAATGTAGIPNSLSSYFAQASASTGVPIGILGAIARQESGFTNPANGQGVMQILASTAAHPGYGLAPLNPALRGDPATNIQFGASYLAARARATGLTSWDDPTQLARALTAYNGGGDPNYAAHVMRGATLPMSSANTVALTAPGTDRAAWGNDRAGEVKNSIDAPYLAAQQSIADTTRQVQLLNATIGKTPAQIAGANAAEQLRTQYIHDFGDQSKWSADLVKQLNDNIAKTGTAAGDAAQKLQVAQEKQQKAIQGADFWRTSATDLINAPLDALAQHKNPGQALRQAGASFGMSLLHQGVGSLVGDLFGKSGTPLGGIFGNLLGGGKSQTGTMDVNAAVVNVNGSGITGALGSLTGNGTAAGGGLLSGLGSWLGSLFKFSDGGIMTNTGSVPLRRYADGGIANTPQLAMFGEGSGPEAYVPLKNGGIPVNVSMKLPAFMKQQPANQNVVQHNLRGGDIIVQGNADEKTIAMIRAETARSNAALLQQMNRNIGSSMAKWQQNYG